MALILIVGKGTSAHEQSCESQEINLVLNKQQQQHFTLYSGCKIFVIGAISITYKYHLCQQDFWISIFKRFMEGTVWKSQKVNSLPGKTNEIIEFPRACWRWESQDLHRVSPSLLTGFSELITYHENPPWSVNIFWMFAPMAQRNTSFMRAGEASAGNQWREILH